MIIKLSLLLPVNVTAFSDSRYSSTFSLIPSKQTKSPSTRLAYRDNSESSPIILNSSTTQTASLVTTNTNIQQQRVWWNPFSTEQVQETSESSSQTIVDEYLEFLERRYHRLHDEDEEPPTFSVLNWLKHEPVALQTNTDVLYSLGVAGLASERLLTKYQSSVFKTLVSRKKEAAEASTVVVATNVHDTKPRTAAIAMLSVVFAQHVAPTIHALVRQRKALLRFQAQKLAAVAAVLGKTLATIPKLATRSLWNLSGGQQNVARTFTFVAMVAFVFLKPVAEVIVSEGVRT
jgi:hypothetical protein